MSKKLKLEIERITGKPFTYGDNQSQFEKVIMYFRRDKEFENLPNASLDKGLFLWGNTGTGKTTLMLAAEELIRKQVRKRMKPSKDFFKNVSCGDIVLQENDEDCLEGIKYYTKMSFNREGTSSFNWCFHELGWEDKGDYAKNIMKPILEYRYQKFVECGMKTHVTANTAEAKDLEPKFGNYIYDRFREMFNFIKFTGKSLRR